MSPTSPLSADNPAEPTLHDLTDLIERFRSILLESDHAEEHADILRESLALHSYLGDCAMTAGEVVFRAERVLCRCGHYREDHFMGTLQCLRPASPGIPPCKCTTFQAAADERFRFGGPNYDRNSTPDGP